MPSISLASYFCVDHLTFNPSIPLASYFCAIHPLGKSFSCRPFNFPVFGELFSCRTYNSPLIHPFGELFFVPFLSNSPPIHPFGELFLYCTTLGRYFRAYYLILHPLASYFLSDYSIVLSVYPFGEFFFCVVHSLGDLFSYRPFNCPSFGELF